MIAIALSVILVAAAAPVPAPPSAAVLRMQVLGLLNAHRRAMGLLEFHVDPIAQRAAQFQAEQVSASGTISHVDDFGRGPMTRYLAFGGGSPYYGENVAFHSLHAGDADDLRGALAKLDGAMLAEQPPYDGHRRNILSPRFSAVGIGIAVSEHAIYLVEDFSGM